MVHLNGTNIINETHTSNETSILATYPVCSCASYNISVHISIVVVMWAKVHLALDWLHSTGCNLLQFVLGIACCCFLFPDVAFCCKLLLAIISYSYFFWQLLLSLVWCCFVSLGIAWSSLCCLLLITVAYIQFVTIAVTFC